VLFFATDLLSPRHVLRRLAHGDVDVGVLVGVAGHQPGVVCIRRVRIPAAVAGDALDPDRQEHITLAGLDRVRRDPRGHQRPRALLRSCDVYTLVTNVSGFIGDIPAGLDWLKDSESGRAWLAALPQKVVECAAHWRLRLSAPYPYAFTSLAVPAHLEDGSDVVLKVVFIDRETEHEADALRLWDGDGAIRLLDELPTRGALLLERCVPGTPLSSAGADVAMDVLEGL